MTDAVTVRLLRQDELDDADRIFRIAFGTFLGLPDPLTFAGDADLLRSRWLADPDGALAAELDGRLVGTNVVTRWGSVGYFGPLTIEPAHWDSGIARRLLDATMDVFDRWGVTLAGLFTFPQSPKHLALYQRYGFWPQHLTPIMARPVPAGTGTGFTAAGVGDLDAVISECAELTDAIYPGLDVAREIRAVVEQKLGETVLVRDDAGRMVAFGVCHSGAGTEGGSGSAYVKVGAARSGADFERLLEACTAFAASRGVAVLTAGVNTARRGAYAAMLRLGFRTEFVGVAMHRPDAPGLSHPEAWVVDDWR